MKLSWALPILVFAGAAVAQPAAWTDARTGHRIVRLSDQPGMASLYFNESAFTPQGDKMAISTADGIATIDMKTWKIAPLVKAERGRRLRLLFTGRRTRSVYYAMGDLPTAGASGAGVTQVWAADVDSGKTRKIADVDGQVQALNADETLLAGVKAAREMPLQPGGSSAQAQAFGQTAYAANGPDGKPLTFADAKEVRLNERLEARIPMEIFTIDIRTGARKVLQASTDWLNHLQFSPTDPALLMFCHEGNWHKVDRLWTIRTDGSGLTKIHTRTMNMEIAGHEFWSPDGKTIWYDLQTPRGEDFWLAAYDIATAKRRWYHLTRDEWSVHFNVSPDQKLFAGDGGDSEMVAHAPDGKYIYLFRLQPIPDVAGIHADNSESLIAPGTLVSEKLVDMAKHDYRLEPNIHFSPDAKWLIFRSNLEGVPHIYAVEIARAADAAPTGVK